MPVRFRQDINRVSLAKNKFGVKCASVGDLVLCRGLWFFEHFLVCHRPVTTASPNGLFFLALPVCHQPVTALSPVCHQGSFGLGIFPDVTNLSPVRRQSVTSHKKT